MVKSSTPLHTRHTIMNNSWVNLTDENRWNLLAEISRREFQRLIPSVVILGVFCLTGTIGNSVSVYVFASRMKRNFQNNLFIYLCLNNTMACSVCIPGDIVDLVFAFNYPSSAACKVTRFFNMFTLASYVLTLGTISVYRLRAASVARLAAPTKQTSVRGIVIIVFVSIGIAWLGAVVYGIRSTPTGMRGVFGQDCALADDIADTGWPAGFYSFLGIGFTTLVLTVGISYYKIWRIVRRSKTNVAGHTTVNAVSQFAAGLTVTPSRPEDRPAHRAVVGSSVPEAESGSCGGGGPGMHELLPAISVVYLAVNSHAGPIGEETAHAGVASSPTGDDVSEFSLSTASEPNVRARHVTKTDLCGVTSLCVFGKQTSTGEKMYRRFGSNSFKGSYSPVKCKAMNKKRIQLNGARSQSRSNPDLATIDADKKASSLIRALSFSELGGRANQGQSAKTKNAENCRNIIKADLIGELPKDKVLFECGRLDCDSTQLIKIERKNSKSVSPATENNLAIEEANSSLFQIHLPLSDKTPTKSSSKVKTFFVSDAKRVDYDISQNSQNGVTTTEVTLGDEDGKRFGSKVPSMTTQTLTPVKTSARTKTTKTALEIAITRTAFLLTFTFILSYLPFFVVSIPHFLIPDFDYKQDTATLNVINMSYRLYFINPTISPFIFWASNLDFRRGLKAFCTRD